MPTGSTTAPSQPADAMATAGLAARRRWDASRTVLWAAAVLGGIAIHYVLWQFSEPSALFSDFYKANWPAAEYLWHDGWSAEWPLTEKGGFSNLPALGWLYVPLIWLGEELAGWAFWGIGFAALIGGWALLVRVAQLKETLAAGLLFLVLVNGPVLNGLREAQSSQIILFFLALALVLWRSRRDYAAGVALGICAMFKLPLLFLGVFFLWRRRWRIVLGGATPIALALGFTIAQFGVDGLVVWYHDWVTPYLGNAIPAFNVQSIDGFLIRLAKGAAYLRHWDPPIEPSLAHKIARLAAFAALFGGAYVLLRRAHRNVQADAMGVPGANDLLGFSLVLVLALITSPISWTHYYIWLLIPWALYLGGRLRLPPDATTRWLMRAGIVSASLPIVLWVSEEPTWINEILARTVTSLCLFGGLAVFAALARGAHHSGSRTLRFPPSPRVEPT